MSDELKSLISHRQQIKSWLADTNARIAELEEAYLEDTPHGNIVRGFETDGRLLPLRKSVDDKERMFSNSSYQYWLSKNLQDPEVERKISKGSSLQAADTLSQGSTKSHSNKHRKHRKIGGNNFVKKEPGVIASVVVEDWDMEET